MIYEVGTTEEIEVETGPIEAGSMRVAVMPDLDRLQEILGTYLFNAMQSSSVRLREEEDDKREGKEPRKVTSAMRLYFATQEGEDFTLEVKLGFDTGRETWFKAYPQV